MSAENIIDRAFELIGGPGYSFGTGMEFNIPTGFSNVVNFAPPIIQGLENFIPQEAGEMVEAGGLTNPELELAGEPEKPALDLPSESMTIPDLALPDLPEFVVGSPLATRPDLTPGQRPTDGTNFGGVVDFGSAGLSSPTVPTFSYEDRTALESIDVDAFVPTVLAPFAENLPDYEMPEALTLTPPDPITYDGDQSLLAALGIALQDAGLLSSSDQQAMFLEQTEELTRLQERELFAIKELTAAQGFFMPTGAAHGKMLLVVEKTLKEREKASTTVRDEAHKRAITTLTAAAQAGLALESAHLKLHLAYVEHLMQVERYNVKLAAELLNTAVELYNQKLAALQPHINAYKTYIAAVREQNSAPAVLAKVKAAYVDSIQADTEMLVAQSETMGVAGEADGLRYQGMLNELEEYMSKTKTVMENLKRLGLGIERYEAELRQYQVDVETRIEKAKSNQVEFENWATGEETKGTQEQVRAAYLNVLAQRSQSYASLAGGVNQTISQAVQAYGRYASANQSYLAAYTDKLETIRTVEAARDSGLKSLESYASAKTRVDASKTSTQNQINLTQAEHATRQEIVNVQDATFDASIRAGQLAAQAKTAASVAQAAYGVFGANLNLTGLARLSDSQTYSDYLNYAENGNRNYSYSESVSV